MYYHLLKNYSNYLDLVKPYMDNGSVYTNEKDGLIQYCYNQSEAYKHGWGDILKISRGIVFEKETGKLVAVPMVKFFNLGEDGYNLNDLPLSLDYQIFNKWDGSLIIVFWHNDKWNFATKGSLKSDQAKMAEELFLKNQMTLDDKNLTYLFELVGPENQIVVRYKEPELILLETIHRETLECNTKFSKIPDVSSSLHTLEDLMGFCETHSDPDMEGFVIVFSNGLRVKIKTQEYLKLHRIMTRLSPKNILENMVSEPLQERNIIEQLPEEHRDYYISVTNRIKSDIFNTFQQVINTRLDIINTLPRNYNRKDYALMVKKIPNIQGYLFMLESGSTEDHVRQEILKNYDITNIKDYSVKFAGRGDTIQHDT